MKWPSHAPIVGQVHKRKQPVRHNRGVVTCLRTWAHDPIRPTPEHTHLNPDTHRSLTWSIPWKAQVMINPCLIQPQN